MNWERVAPKPTKSTPIKSNAKRRCNVRKKRQRNRWTSYRRSWYVLGKLKFCSNKSWYVRWCLFTVRWQGAGEGGEVPWRAIRSEMTRCTNRTVDWHPVGYQTVCCERYCIYLMYGRGSLARGHALTTGKAFDATLLSAVSPQDPLYLQIAHLCLVCFRLPLGWVHCRSEWNHRHSNPLQQQSSKGSRSLSKPHWFVCTENCWSSRGNPIDEQGKEAVGKRRESHGEFYHVHRVYLGR